MSTQELISTLDASRNWVEPYGEGLIECRYVRRVPDYVIAYLSCQAGCRHACRFCHLTQTGQTSDDDVPAARILAQAKTVLAHYRTQEPARVIHFNFMARGEPLAARALLDDGDALLSGLHALARAEALIPRVKISSIMPRSLDRELIELFPLTQPDLYYSLYSVDQAFRRTWLPKALPHAEALGMLTRWQQTTRKLPVIHFALIAGANDAPGQIDGVIEAITQAGLRCDVNLVRYNPARDGLGHEPEEAAIARAADQLRAGLPGARVKVIPRVGFDVKASCGMFVA